MVKPCPAARQFGQRLPAFAEDSHAGALCIGVGALLCRAEIVGKPRICRPLILCIEIPVAVTVWLVALRLVWISAAKDRLVSECTAELVACEHKLAVVMAPAELKISHAVKM